MKLKFFDSYAYDNSYAFTFIFAALILITKVLASNVVSLTHPSAVEVFEQFGIPGLRDSTDLEWFSSRWNLENVKFFNDILKFSVLSSDIFFDNRIPLIKHLFEGEKKGEDDQFDSELVQVLIDLKEYEILIELFCKYPKQMNEILVDLLNNQNQTEEFYKVLKVSSNMEAFLEKSEIINDTVICILCSLAVLDNEPLPPHLLNFFFSKFDIAKIIIDFTIKKAKDLKMSNDELYFKITRFWDMFISYIQSNLNAKLQLFPKLFKMIILADDVSLEDLDITEFDSMEHKISLFSLALILKKEILIDQIIFNYSPADLENIINNIVNVNKYEEDLCSYLIFCVYRKLPKVAQTLILNSTNYNIFVEKKFKIFNVKITESDAFIKFGAKDLVKDYGIPTRLSCKISGPITVGKLIDWFDNMKFASPSRFSQFLIEISKLPAFETLIKLEQVNVHINSLMQVTTDEALNNQIRSLGICLHSNDHQIYKILKEENILNMSEIVSKSLIIKLIRYAVYDQVTWQNLDRFCGGKLSELLIEYSNDFNESDQFMMRYALVHRMNDRKKLLMGEIKRS